MIHIIIQHKLQTYKEIQTRIQRCTTNIRRQYTHTKQLRNIVQHTLQNVVQNSNTKRITKEQYKT